jgi:hypothetical protein
MPDSQNEQPQSETLQSQEALESQEAQEPPAPPPTPFDHPLFLPAILSGLALWFGYDGWFNPEMGEHLSFNRYGFGVLLLGAIWFGYKGLQEIRESREIQGSEGDSSNSATPGT